MQPTFAERFRMLHERSGLSQTAAAERIYTITGVRIPQTTLSGYLSKTDPQVPSVMNAAAIAESYNVSIEWLCGMTNDRRTVDALTRRLKELNFEKRVEEVARQLMQMPDAYREEVIGKSKSIFQQWQTLKMLIEFARLMDPSGQFLERISELTGIDPSRLDSTEKLVTDRLFDDGDAESINHQFALELG